VEESYWTGAKNVVRTRLHSSDTLFGEVGIFVGNEGAFTFTNDRLEGLFEGLWKWSELWSTGGCRVSQSDTSGGVLTSELSNPAATNVSDTDILLPT